MNSIAMQHMRKVRSEIDELVANDPNAIPISAVELVLIEHAGLVYNFWDGTVIDPETGHVANEQRESAPANDRGAS